VPVEDHSPSVSPTDFHLEGCRKAPHNTVNIICIICNIAVHPDFATNSSCFDSFTPNFASSDPDLASIAFIFVGIHRTSQKKWAGSLPSGKMNIWKITDLTLVFGVANEKKNIVAQRSWPMENHQEFHGKDYSLPVIPIP